MPDEITDLKRAQEVFDRPSKTAPTPTPKELQSDTSSKTASTPTKSAPSHEIEKSLDWNKQQGKALESYAKGTPNVPKSGVYRLEKGEAVIPKHMNWMNPDGMSGLKGKAQGKKAKVVTLGKKSSKSKPAPATPKPPVKTTGKKGK